MALFRILIVSAAAAATLAAPASAQGFDTRRYEAELAPAVERMSEAFGAAMVSMMHVAGDMASEIGDRMRSEARQRTGAAGGDGPYAREDDVARCIEAAEDAAGERGRARADEVMAIEDGHEVTGVVDVERGADRSFRCAVRYGAIDYVRLSEATAWR